MHWEVELECHVLPESCSRPSIGNCSWPSLLWRKQEQEAPSPSSLPHSWSVSFDVKVPGRAGLCHCQLGEGDSSGPHLNRQTGPHLGAPAQQRGPELSQTPALHPRHLERIQSDGYSRVALDSRDSSRLPISPFLTLASVVLPQVRTHTTMVNREMWITLHRRSDQHRVAL